MTNSSWPVVSFGSLMRLDLDRVSVTPGTLYPMVGVYSFGRGLFSREPVDGGSTSYNTFYRIRSNHLVMSQLFGWEGAIAFADDCFAGMYLSPQFPTFSIDESLIDRDFLRWYLKRPAFWQSLGRKLAELGIVDVHSTPMHC